MTMNLGSDSMPQKSIATESHQGDVWSTIIFGKRRPFIGISNTLRLVE
jgi:hypothetical protein